MGIGIGTRRIGATTQTRGDVRDIEVLRVSAQLISDSSGLTVPSARNAVLRWAKKRAGRRLPDPAWAFQDFEDLAAGRNISAVRIENQNRDLWAMRAEDPDKKVVGRAWSTEIVIGGEVGGPTQICLRLIISTNEASIDIEPHVPGLVLQMIDGPGLVSNDRKLVAEPVLIRTESDAHDLCDLLEDPDRRLPVFVAALPEEESESPLIDDCMLARATAGLARSYRLPVNLTWVLTQRFGSKRSVYNGAVRAYLRGFDGNDDPFRHSLILRSYLELDKANAESTVARLRSLAARASLSETRLGVDVLDFVSVRAASRKIRNQELASSSATDEEKLQATEQLVETLSKQIRVRTHKRDSQRLRVVIQLPPARRHDE